MFALLHKCADFAHEFCLWNSEVEFLLQSRMEKESIDQGVNPYYFVVLVFSLMFVENNRLLFVSVLEATHAYAHAFGNFKNKEAMVQAREYDLCHVYRVAWSHRVLLCCAADC